MEITRKALIGQPTGFDADEAGFRRENPVDEVCARLQDDEVCARLQDGDAETRSTAARQLARLGGSGRSLGRSSRRWSRSAVPRQRVC